MQQFIVAPSGVQTSLVVDVCDLVSGLCAAKELPMTQMRPNLNFAGFAGDALAHYHQIFGGEVEVMRFAGSPAAVAVPPDWGDKLLYARLITSFGEIDIMDAPPGNEGHIGGNIAIAVDVDDDERAAQIFAKLAQGGEILMPFEPTFFARNFGMTADKFGVRWMVTVAPVALVS